MTRMRAIFSKGESVRFIGHLDILRTLERAVRRAELPFAMSQGFNPRQKLAFASPLPVGTVGLAEPMDMELTEDVAPPELVERINAALPGGLRFREAFPVPAEAPALMADLIWSEYLVRWPGEPAPEMDRLLELFLQQPEVPVLRHGKRGERLVDIRPAVLALERSEAPAGEVCLRLCLSEEPGRSARPREVLEALRKSAGMDISSPLTARLSLGLGHGLRAGGQEADEPEIPPRKG